MQQLLQIRDVVKAYTILPGLILASIGFYGVLSGTFNILLTYWLYWQIQHTYPALADYAAFAGFVLPIILYCLIIYVVTRYYMHKVGQVKANDHTQKVLGIEAVIAFFAYVFIGQKLDTSLHSPISVGLLIFAAFLAVHWWLLAREQFHYLLLAGIVVILSCIPLFNASVYHWLYLYTAPDWYGGNLLICTGIILVIAGSISHWQMMRTLTQVRISIATASKFTE